MTAPSQPHTRLRGRLKVVTQVAWLFVVGVALAAFAAGVPARFSQLLHVVTSPAPGIAGQLLGLSAEQEAVLTSRLGPAEAGALRRLGLALAFYAGYVVTFEVMLALVCAAIGGFIFWRRSDDWMTLWVSLVVVILGTNAFGFVVLALATVWPTGMVLAYTTAVGLLGMVSLPHILFLSPDGQFVPRWTLLIAAGSTGGVLALGIFSLLTNQGVWSLSLLLPVFLLWLGVLAIGVVNQVYRYRRVSDAVQRQQTKWMVIGLGAVAVGFVLNATFLGVPLLQAGLPRVLVHLIRASLVNGCMAFLPVCLAFSIFRYRLWDIDLLIRRTLVYSALSGLLALIYFGLVTTLQTAFRSISHQQSEISIVLSTLAIAALFFPLRNRVQLFIDRRFYRQKYDAQKVLTRFAATCRDETDIETLTTRLAEAVRETMQPESVSLWLAPAGQNPSTAVRFSEAQAGRSLRAASSEKGTVS